METILNETTLRAYNHFCLFSPALRESTNDSIANKFKVVCFTETPIDQIHLLLRAVSGRNLRPSPYGLVFKKDYVRSQGGNPVFYVTKKIAKPLWPVYRSLFENPEQTDMEVCRLLALVTLCDESVDFHWEREWRTVGNLTFEPEDIYFGLCPQDDIPYFEETYPPVKFLSPDWGINKILSRLVGR